MTDQDTTIIHLRKLVASFVQERDWEQFHNPKDLATAISVEGAELLELFLWKTLEEVNEATQRPEMQQRIEEELADILIYCFNLANRLNIDVTNAVVHKLEANKAKYPVDKAKGTAKKYTEF